MFVCQFLCSVVTAVTFDNFQLFYYTLYIFTFKTFLFSIKGNRQSRLNKKIKKECIKINLVNALHFFLLRFFSFLPHRSLLFSHPLSLSLFFASFFLSQFFALEEIQSLQYHNMNKIGSPSSYFVCTISVFGNLALLSALFVYLSDYLLLNVPYSP